MVRRTFLIVLCITIASISMAGPVSAESLTPNRSSKQFLANNSGTNTVRMEHARELKWKPSVSQLIASGNVRIRSGKYRVDAEKITYHENSDVLVAEDDVRARIPGSGELIGEYFELHRSTNKIVTKNVLARSLPWNVRAKSIEGDADTQLKMSNVEITTDDLIHRQTPHYSIKASEFYVYPGNRLVGYDATVNIAGYPIFYLPVVQLNEQGGLSRWDVTPGYDDRNGIELEVDYDYLIESDGAPITGTLYTDFREESGGGAGFDVTYDKLNRQANLFFFIANRKPTVINNQGKEVFADEKETLWRLDSDVNYSLEDSTWKIQSDVDWIENNRFNTDFQGSLDNRAQPRRQVEAALVKWAEKSIFRIDVERDDTARQIGNRIQFQRKRTTLPRIQYQLFSTPLRVLSDRTHLKFDGTVEKFSEANASKRLWNTRIEPSLIQSVHWNQRFNQSYRIGYEHQYNQRRRDEEFQSVGTGRFELRNSLNFGSEYYFDLNYVMRDRINNESQVQVQINGDTFGIEEDGRPDHNLNFNLRWGARSTFAYLQSGYDLRNSVTQDIDTDKRVLSPQFNLSTELTSIWRWNQYFRYDWDAHEINQLGTDWKFPLTRDLSIGFDWNFNRTSGENFSKIGQSFDWRTSDHEWRFQGDFLYDPREDDFEEKKFSVSKRLHHWRLEVMFREIDDRDRQILFNLDFLEPSELENSTQPSLFDYGVRQGSDLSSQIFDFN